MADSLFSRFGCYTIIWDTTRPARRGTAPPARSPPSDSPRSHQGESRAELGSRTARIALSAARDPRP